MVFQSEYTGWQQGAFIPPANTIAPHGQQLQESIEEAVQRTVAGAIPHIVDQLHDRNPPNTAEAIEEAVQRTVEGTIPHLVNCIRRETAEEHRAADVSDHSTRQNTRRSCSDPSESQHA